jgi:lysozyme family protein
MSQAAFEKLEANYEHLASIAVIKPEREPELQRVVERTLLPEKLLYQRVEGLVHIPAAALMALAMREMSGNTHCYLGNGQSLKHRTTIVPLNRGPFLQEHPEDFVAGCLDSLHLDGLDQVWTAPGGWSRSRFCYESESWNGWGYRSRGIPSPYVFGATNIQKPGKFPRDHIFDPTLWDPQLGTLAIVEEIFKQDSSLKFYDYEVKKPSSTIDPEVSQHPIIGTFSMEFVQSALNKLRTKGTPLIVDGNIGRASRAAVYNFQLAHHVYPYDGIPGPKTIAALKEALSNTGA